MPSRRSVRSPALRSTVRCWEIAGRVTSKWEAISPALSSSIPDEGEDLAAAWLGDGAGDLVHGRMKANTYVSVN